MPVLFFCSFSVYFSDERWMSDYEYFKEGTLESWQKMYGTPMKNIPISKIPCGGCGAFLQCQVCDTKLNLRVYLHGIFTTTFSFFFFFQFSVGASYSRLSSK